MSGTVNVLNLDDISKFSHIFCINEILFMFGSYKCFAFDQKIWKDISYKMFLIKKFVSGKKSNYKNVDIKSENIIAIFITVKKVWNTFLSN